MEITSYPMDHPRRGVAAIFNQEEFDSKELPRRKGSDVDCKRLFKTFSRLGLEVEIYRNLTLFQISYRINELSARDYSDCDCFVLIFMSHGLEGWLMAKDKHFRINLLWDNFTTEGCPSLANKPKIFIIQSCQGNVRQGSVSVYSEDSQDRGIVKLVPSYKLPKGPDFLIALASMPGFVASRSDQIGSLYILTLCAHLEKDGFHQDLVTLLTRVSQSVALHHPHLDIKTKTWMKQMPSFISLLVRRLQFQKCRASKRAKKIWCIRNSGSDGKISSGRSRNTLEGRDDGGRRRQRSKRESYFEFPLRKKRKK